MSEVEENAGDGKRGLVEDFVFHGCTCRRSKAATPRLYPTTAGAHAEGRKDQNALSSIARPEPPAHTPDVDGKENATRIVWALAWPAVALNSLQVINMLLDSLFVGALEPAALTAMGGSTAVMFFLFSIAAAVGVASTALVSRSYGARALTELRRANRECLSLSLFGGVALMAFGMAIAPFAARSFIPADNVRAIQLSADFLAIYSVGLPALFIIQSLAGSLRGIGDTKSPMIISGVQIGLHIVLNFLLMFPTRAVEVGTWSVIVPGADLGLHGAAYGLTISAWMAAVVYWVWSKRTDIDGGRLALPDWGWAVRIVRIAFPAALMGVVRVSALMAFTLVLREVPNGSEAIAAMRVGFALESFAFMPAFGLAIAASALVGQSLGMKRPDRAERLAWLAAHHAGAVSAMVALILFFFGGAIAHAILPNQPEVAEIVRYYLLYIAITEVFLGYAMVLIGAMQGAGDTRRPMWITLVSMWLIRVPLAAYFALPLGMLWTIPFVEWTVRLPNGWAMGSNGCWLSMCVTQAVSGVLAMVYFKLGAWKHQQV